MRNRSETAIIAEYENAERSRLPRECRPDVASPEVGRVARSQRRQMVAFSTDCGAHWSPGRPVLPVIARIDAICERLEARDRSIALKSGLRGSFFDEKSGDIPDGTVFVTERGPDGTRNGRFVVEKRAGGPLGEVVRAVVESEGSPGGSPVVKRGYRSPKVARKVVSRDMPPEDWVLFGVDGRISIERRQFRSVLIAMWAVQVRLRSDDSVFRVVRVVRGMQRSSHVVSTSVHALRLRQFAASNGTIDPSALGSVVSDPEGF